jgi:hypothetical protein
VTLICQILREDVETALAESTLAQERAALMMLEQQELQRQRDQLAGESQAELLNLEASCVHTVICVLTISPLLFQPSRLNLLAAAAAAAATKL